jgi:hypothetical protein
MSLPVVPKPAGAEKTVQGKMTQEIDHARGDGRSGGIDIVPRPLTSFSREKVEQEPALNEGISFQYRNYWRKLHGLVVLRADQFESCPEPCCESLHHEGSAVTPAGTSESFTGPQVPRKTRDIVDDHGSGGTSSCDHADRRW